MSSRREYYEKHTVCPECGHFTWKDNVRSVWFGRRDNFKDLNHTKCVCGWEGKVHDLVSRAERAPVVYLVWCGSHLVATYGDRGKAVARVCELKEKHPSTGVYTWSSFKVES